MGTGESWPISVPNGDYYAHALAARFAAARGVGVGGYSRRGVLIADAGPGVLNSDPGGVILDDDARAVE
jgi:hypothetical protein